jgi:hypothetical protein
MMDNIEHYPTENYQNASDRGNHSYMEKKPFNCLDNHADCEMPKLQKYRKYFLLPMVKSECWERKEWSFQ